MASVLSFFVLFIQLVHFPSTLSQRCRCRDRDEMERQKKGCSLSLFAVVFCSLFLSYTSSLASERWISWGPVSLSLESRVEIYCLLFFVPSSGFSAWIFNIEFPVFSPKPSPSGWPGRGWHVQWRAVRCRRSPMSQSPKCPRIAARRSPFSHRCMQLHFTRQLCRPSWWYLLFLFEFVFPFALPRKPPRASHDEKRKRVEKCTQRSKQ